MPAIQRSAVQRSAKSISRTFSQNDPDPKSRSHQRDGQHLKKASMGHNREAGTKHHHMPRPLRHQHHRVGHCARCQTTQHR